MIRRACPSHITQKMIRPATLCAIGADARGAPDPGHPARAVYLCRGCTLSSESVGSRYGREAKWWKPGRTAHASARAGRDRTLQLLCRAQIREKARRSMGTLSASVVPQTRHKPRRRASLSKRFPSQLK
jgi:hypothetical protein